MRKLLALLSLVCAVSVEAAPTLISRWDFDNYNPANIVDALKPSAGTSSASIGICNGSGASTAALAGIIGPAYLVDGSVAPGLSAGDYAIALPKGTHLKVPFPGGVIKNKHWTVRVRFFHPAASGGKPRAILQPALNNKGQYFFGLDAGNRLWIDHNNAPGKNYTGADGAENGFSAGNTPSRTAGVSLWHTLTVCFGNNGVASYLNGVRNTSSLNTNDPRGAFTGDGLLLFADDTGEDELVYVSSVELWQDTPVYHAPNYIPTASGNLFSIASLNDVRDGLCTVRGLGTWISYSTPLHSFERIVTADDAGNATSLKLDFATWGGDQNVLAQFTQNENNVVGNSLRMAWNLGWNQRYFTDTGDFVQGQQSMPAGTTWNFNGYAPYNLFCTPFITLKGDIKWTKLLGVGKFGVPRVTVCVGSATLTFDRPPQVDSLAFESGFGDGRVNLNLAYLLDDYKTMSGIGELKVDKDVTLTLPVGVSVGGTLVLQKGAALSVPGISPTAPTTLLTTSGGVVLPQGVPIESFVSYDTGRVSLSQDGKQILYTPFTEGAVATAVWSGGGDQTNPADPRNWTCRGADGAVIAGAVPTADTTVQVSGETTLNVPAEAGFVCRRVSFMGAASLAQDCDWRGLNGVATVGGATVTIPEETTLTLASVGDFSQVCSFVGAGRLKVMDDGSFTGVFPASVVGCAEVEMAGDVNFTGCNWTSGNRLILSGHSVAKGEGSTSGMSGPIVIPEGAVLTVDGQVNAPSCKGETFRQHIVVDGGTLTGGGFLYFSAWNNQELDIDINAGRLETAVTPWASYYPSGCKIVQTGGVFAPSSLQPRHQNNVYKGTYASYTFKGGVFEPPAGWTTGFPWLPITVPADGEATIHLVRSATVAAPVTIDGTLMLTSDDPAYTLTFASLAGNGTLQVGSGSPRIMVPAGDWTPQLTSAEGMTLALGGSGEDPVVFTTGLTNEVFLGSLTLTGGLVKLPKSNSIGGVLALEAGAKLRFDTGTDHLAALVPLFTAAGGVVLPEGVALTDCVSVTAGTVTLSDDGRQILFVPDASVPITAVWVGAGNRADPTDTANWACTNVLGEAVVAIPTDATTIFLSGETTLNVPVDTMPTCRELRITGPIALGADCDWRGLDSLTRLVDGTVVDLQGHALALACANGASPTTVTVTNSTTMAGTLTFEVPEGATFTNSKIALLGNLKLVKEGSGTLIPERRNQTYSDGTDIVAGTVKATTIGTDAPTGLLWADSKIWVREGATFDIGSSYHFTPYLFVLDGGRFLSSGKSSNMCRFGKTTLTADSRLEAPADLQFWSSHVLDLGGKTLTVAIGTSGACLNFGENGSTNPVTIQNGVVDVTAGGWFKIISPVNAATADIRMGAALSVGASFDVHDYEAIYSPAFCQGTGVMRVFGRFTPHHGGFYGCVLQNGSTLDLSYLDDVWSTTRTITGSSATGNGTVTFADGAVVTVDLGARKVGALQKVATWTQTPVNYTTLRFKAPRGANYRVFAKEDGIYANCGIVVLLR